MSIKLKLSILVVILSGIILLVSGFFIWNIKRMQQSAEMITISLDGMRSASDTRLLINRQIKEVIDFVATGEEEEIEEYSKHGEIVEINFENWKNISLEIINSGSQENLEIINAISKLQESYLDAHRLIDTTFSLVRNNKLDQAYEMYREKLNPYVKDSIFADIDHALIDEFEIVEESYRNLYMVIGVFPWISEETTDHIESSRFEIQKFMIADKARILIGRQLKNIMYYLITRDEDELEYFEQFENEINYQLNAWIQLEESIAIENNSENLSKAKKALEIYDTFGEGLKFVASNSSERSTYEKFDYVEEHFENVFDETLSPLFDEVIDTNFNKVKKAHLQIESVVNNFSVVAIFVLLILSFLVIYISVRITNKILKSISEMLDGINLIGTGKLEERIPISSNDEFGQLSNAFNKMTANLETSMVSLKNSEENLSTILASISEAVIVTDLNTRIIFMNKQSEILTGINENKNKGEKIGNLLVMKEEGNGRLFEDDKIDSSIDIMHPRNINLETKDGEIIPILLSVSNLKTGDGTEKGYVFVLRNISSIKELQKKLLEQEKMATIGKLTSVVSHELRNPLGTIRSSSYFIYKKTEGQDLGIKKALERLERNVIRCDLIINELLDYMRNKELELFPTNFDEWISNLAYDYTEEIFKIKKDLNFGQKIHIDREQLRRVVTNLLNNARQAIEESGSPLEDSDGEKISISTKKENNNLVIVINDRGPGIVEEKLIKIFEPLFSTKSFGLGLGLPIVKQIVEQHGGAITVKSEIAVGTEFTIKLPLKEG